jgi:hypothetical protein
MALGFAFEGSFPRDNTLGLSIGRVFVYSIVCMPGLSVDCLWLNVGSIKIRPLSSRLPIVHLFS